MTHSERTADRSYIRPDQAKVAAAGHALLKSNIGYRESDDEEGDELMDVDKGCEVGGYEQMDVDEGDVDEVVEADKEEIDEVEDTLLLDLFNSEISSNVTLTQDLVTSKISKNTALGHLDLTNKTLVKKIMNKLRYQQTIAARRSLERKTTEKVVRKDRLNTWIEESFSAVSEGARSRLAWSEEHTEAIESYFSKFPVRPDKSQIIAHLEAAPSLRDVLAKEGATRCYQKLKNIFKRRSK